MIYVLILQMRYAAGTKDILDRFFNNKPLKKDDVIVEVGRPNLITCQAEHAGHMRMQLKLQLPEHFSVCRLSLPTC